MKGIHRVVIQNKRIRYDFELRRNLTVLRGDSATGKTTLIEMIQEFINNGEDSSIELRCDKSCYVFDDCHQHSHCSKKQHLVGNIVGKGVILFQSCYEV